MRYLAAGSGIKPLARGFKAHRSLIELTRIILVGPVGNDPTHFGLKDRYSAN